MKIKKYKYFTGLLFFLLIFFSFSILNAGTPKNLKIIIKKATNPAPGLYLTWSYQKPYNQTTQVNYKIERKSNNSAWKEIVRKGGDKIHKYYLDNSVAPNVTYCYRVKLWSGNTWSNEACFHTPNIPSAPINLKGQIKYPEPGKNEFIIDWSDQANNEEGFEVKFNGYMGGVEYLIPNSYYFSLIRKHVNCPPITFKVRAYNLYYSPFAVLTLDAAPNPIPGPKYFRATFVNGVRISLSWSNPLQYTTIRIERKDLGSIRLIKKGVHMVPKFKIIKTVSPANNITQFTDTSIKPQSKYLYRIRGSFNFGDGYSKTLEVKTPKIEKIKK